MLRENAYNLYMICIMEFAWVLGYRLVSGAWVSFHPLQSDMFDNKWCLS